MASQQVSLNRDHLIEQAHARGTGRSQGTVIEQSRAIAEVQGALIVADRRPRDRQRALAEALESCRTQEVAQHAFFKFPRGGQSVSGPSIHLARELARCWGNVVYSVVELDRDESRAVSEMMAYAWDLETNTRAQLQFLVPHKRDKRGGGEVLTEMRDIYENNANMGARRLRECIFAVLPPYLTKAAEAQCFKTLQDGADDKPLPVRINEAIEAFAKIGIDKKRIEGRMGPVARFTEVDVANMRITYQSIQRGEVRAEEEFPKDDALTGEMMAVATAPKSDATSGKPASTDEAPGRPEPAATSAETLGDGAQATASGDQVGADQATDAFGLALVDDEPHPAQAKAGEIIAEINACISTLDVTAVIARNQADIDAMPDELGVNIEVAADQRKNAIEAQRKKTPAQELAE